MRLALFYWSVSINFCQLLSARSSTSSPPSSCTPSIHFRETRLTFRQRLVFHLAHNTGAPRYAEWITSRAPLNPQLAINHARSAAAKLFSTIDRVPTIDSADPGGKKPDTVLGRITFDDVKFTYPSRPDVPILKGLTLAFEAGKTAALVGASGSGKSTVVQLVERFYDVSSGSVSLDGVDIRELNVKWLRSQIGLVSQEPVLFATTIAGNVAHGLIGTPWENADKETKDRLIREACVKANADSFIQHLPNGYETVVGERGFLLSGGKLFGLDWLNMN